MFLFMIISFLTIPIVFFVGKESVLIIVDEITRGTYSGRYLKKKKNIRQVEPEAPGLVDAPASANSQSENNEEASNRHYPAAERQQAQPRPTYQSTTGSNNVAIEEKPDETKLEFIPNPKEYLSMNKALFYTVILACWLTVIVPSIVVGDVSVFFGIIGSVTSNFTIFIGPGSMYVITIHKKKLGFPTAWSKVKYVIAWIYAVFGIISAVSLCTCVIVNAATK